MNRHNRSCWVLFIRYNPLMHTLWQTVKRYCCKIMSINFIHHVIYSLFLPRWAIPIKEKTKCTSCPAYWISQAKKILASSQIVLFLVIIEGSHICVWFITLTTVIRLLSSVLPVMCFQIIHDREWGSTRFTFVWFLSSMYAHVSDHVTLRAVPFTTHATLVTFKFVLCF